MNTYRSPIRLYVRGSGEIASTEGTTHGDPLAMAMYALAISPLINKLKQLYPNVKQVWYADDATGATTCTRLNYLIMVLYMANVWKTHLIVKKEHEVSAKEIFDGTGVLITTEGERHLGAAIGSRPFAEKYVNNKVEN